MHKEVVVQLLKGMNWVNVALDDTTHEELEKIVLDICNGEIGEGYAHQKYFFQYSFDEEVSEMIAWVEEMNCEIPPQVYQGLFDSKWDNVHKIVKGFQEMNIALGRLSALRRMNPKLQNILTEEKTETDYNPFKRYGIVKFETSLKGWRKAFLKEVKDQIGRRSIDRKTKEVSNQYFENMENGQKLLFEPTALKEEENRIQLLDEVNGSESWYDKSQLQILSEKEYEEWYCNAVLPSILAK